MVLLTLVPSSLYFRSQTTYITHYVFKSLFYKPVYVLFFRYNISDLTIISSHTRPLCHLQQAVLAQNGSLQGSRPCLFVAMARPLALSLCLVSAAAASLRGAQEDGQVSWMRFSSREEEKNGLQSKNDPLVIHILFFFTISMIYHCMNTHPVRIKDLIIKDLMC